MKPLTFILIIALCISIAAITLLSFKTREQKYLIEDLEQLVAEYDYKQGDYQLNVYMDTVNVSNNGHTIGTVKLSDNPTLEEVILNDNQ